MRILGGTTSHIVTLKKFQETVKEYDLKPSSLQDRIGRCIECSADREVTWMTDKDGILHKFIIGDCGH